MNGIVRAKAIDGVELAGYLIDEAALTSTAVLFLHGMYENFYLPLFIEPLAEACRKVGTAFLSGNTRAHDYFVYCRKWVSKREFSWVPQGGAREVFSNCLLDIDSWLSLLERKGHDRVLLVGHSHGALKAAYYSSERPDDTRVIALGLLSPSDDQLIQQGALGARYPEALELANEMIARGEGQALMPSWVYGNPMTAEMYADVFSPNADLAMFSFRTPRSQSRKLARIKVPVQVVFAAHDAATGESTTDQAMEFITRSFCNASRLVTTILPDTDHQYRNKEGELAAAVTCFLDEVISENI
jgi:pimeloyl-ACP methyl ester carboxylesterase